METRAFTPAEVMQRREGLLVDPQIVFVVGPEGSGKSAQAKLLSRRTGLPLIVMGEAFRFLQKYDETELGGRCRDLINNPDKAYSDIDLYKDVFWWRLQLDERGIDFFRDGFILDGAPRTLEQYEQTESFLKEHGINFAPRLLYLTVPISEADERMAKRPDREDDSKVAVRRKDHFSDLFEKRRFARKNWKVTVVHTVKKSIEDINQEAVEKLEIDKTQIRTIQEARLTDKVRRVRDLAVVDIDDVGHDIMTLPENERITAIYEYLRNIDETLSESFGGEIFTRLQYMRRYLMTKLGECYYEQMLRDELKQ